MSRAQLAKVGEETVQLVAAGEYRAPSGRIVSLRDDVERMVPSTRLYTPVDCARTVDDVARTLASTLSSTASVKTRVEVTNETTARATRRLVREGCVDVACLNFASARTPGGGFLSGARAQEEDLARRSALFASLESKAAWPYYETNRAHTSTLYTDHLIWTPRVPFFRDDDLALVDVPWHASVATSPAPNAGALLAKLRPDDDVDATKRAIEETLRRRAEHVIAVCAHEKARHIVLGAWGCGVFKNDPVVVADAFARLLAKYALFERVVFAVFDPSASKPNWRAFAERFA